MKLLVTMKAMKVVFMFQTVWLIHEDIEMDQLPFIFRSYGSWLIKIMVSEMKTLGSWFSQLFHISKSSCFGRISSRNSWFNSLSHSLGRILAQPNKEHMLEKKKQGEACAFLLMVFQACMQGLGFLRSSICWRRRFLVFPASIFNRIQVQRILQHNTPH